MQNKVYAGFFVRLAAYIIDILIINMGLLFVRFAALFSVGALFSKKVFFEYSFIGIISIIVTSVYFVILTYFSGQTIGKMAMNIKVVSTEDRQMSFFEVFVRETFGRFLSSFIANIGYIIIGPNKEKQGLHDIICDTRVVYVNKYKTTETIIEPTIDEKVTYDEIN